MQLNDHYMAFTVANEQYAIALGNIREVITSSEIIPVPFTPEFILGILHRRGQVITVLDLRKRFSLPETGDKSDHSILIIEDNGQILGLLVDSVDCVLKLEQERLAPPPSYTNAGVMRFADRVAQTDRQFVVILSSEKLFSIDETSAPVLERSATAIA